MIGFKYVIVVFFVVFVYVVLRARRWYKNNR